MIDAEEEAAVAFGAEIVKRRQQDLDEAVSFVISHPRGRAFLWEVLARTGMFGASMTGDALTTAFNEGRRHIGIHLFTEALALRPNVFTEMQREHADRLTRYNVNPETQETEDL